METISIDNVTQRDLVINFRKPHEGEIAAKVMVTGEEDPSSFSDKARLILCEALDKVRAHLPTVCMMNWSAGWCARASSSGIISTSCCTL